MEPLQIILIVLAVAGIWALVELAVSLRRARTTMGSLDKTVDELNETIAEAKPVISKLDGALDELQPALTRVDPLLESATVAVDALSANLVEVEAVVRDVSAVTGAAATAGNAVSGITDSATEAVHRFLGRRKGAPAEPERTLEAPDAADGAGEPVHDDAAQQDAAPEADAAPSRYYTYDATEATETSKQAGEGDHE